MRNDISKLLKSTRKAKGLSVDLIYSGLCSRSTYYDIENGSKMPDALLLTSILDRISIPHSYYEIIKTADGEYFDSIKEKFFAILKNCEYDKLREELTHIDLNHLKSPLLIRFYLKLNLSLQIISNGSNQEILDQTLKAIHTTCRDFDPLGSLSGRYDLSELCLMGLYAYKSSDIKLSERLLKQMVVYCYNNITDTEELSIVLPGIAIIFSRLKIDPEYTLNLTQECIKLLRKYKHLTCIDHLMNFAMPENPITEHIKELVSIVPNAGMLMLFPEFFIETQFAMGDFIKNYRVIKGLTRDALAFKICNPSTLYRIENNRQTPQQQIYIEIGRKLDFPIDNSIRYFINVDKFDVLNLGKEIQLLFGIGKYEKMIESLEWLRTQIDMREAVNRQFFGIYKGIALYKMGKIGPNAALIFLGKALRETLPDNIDIKTWTLSNTEIVAICYTAEIYYELDLKSEAINLIEGLYKRKDITVQGRKNVIFSLIRLYNKMQNNKELLDLCHEGMKYSLTSNDAIALCKFNYIRQKLLEKSGCISSTDKAEKILDFWEVDKSSI